MEDDDRTWEDECGDHGGRRQDGEPCGRQAGWGTDNDTGPCRRHLGTSEDGSSHEGNDWAVTHAAYSDSFVQDFLTDEEIERARQAEDLLGEPESAQALARTVAAITLEQFRRTGDDRFLRRYESICDTFGIAPDDELTVHHKGLEDAFMSNLREYHQGD